MKNSLFDSKNERIMNYNPLGLKSIEENNNNKSLINFNKTCYKEFPSGSSKEW